MRDLIKRRNEAGREWRRELVGGGPHIQEKWATFKRLLGGVAGEWRKDLCRKRMKWRLKSLAKSSGANKATWRDLKVRGGHQNIEAVRSETGEAVVDPNEIREENKLEK